MKRAYLLIIILLVSIALPQLPVSAGNNELHPVPYAQVTLTDLESGESLTLVTNASGQVEADVILSPHVINVSTIEGHIPYSANYTPPGDIEITLENGVVLEGTLTDSEGNPQSGVALMANVGGNTFFTKTDENGHYLFILPAKIGDKVSISSQYIEFQLILTWFQYMFGMNLTDIIEYLGGLTGLQMPGIMRYITGVKGLFFFSPKPKGGRGIISFEKEVKINSTVNELNITAQSSLYIEGYVLDEDGNPIPNAIVYSFGAAGFILAMTDDNGYYRLNYDIEVGRHVIVNAICPGYVEGKFEIASINEDEMVNLTLTKSAKLTVLVTDLNGKPVKGASVMVTIGQHTVIRITDSEGKAYIDTNLPEGVASIFVSKPEWNTFANTQVEVSLEEEAYAEVALNVQLGVLEGVVTANGEPVSGLTVSANATTTFGIYWSSAVTDENGHYKLYLPVYDMLGNALKYVVTVKESYYYNSTSLSDVSLSVSETTTINFEVEKKETVHILISVKAEYQPLKYRWLKYNFKAKILGKELNVQIETNSSVLFGLLSFVIYKDKGVLGVAVQGPAETTGELKILIPKELMSPPYIILLDNGTANFINVDQIDHGEFVEIHLKYQHSIHYITVESSTYIPELGLNPILASAIIAISTIVIIRIRKNR